MSHSVDPPQDSSDYSSWNDGLPSEQSVSPDPTRPWVSSDPESVGETMSPANRDRSSASLHEESDQSQSEQDISGNGQDGESPSAESVGPIKEQYKPEYWYSLHGHDWQYRLPMTSLGTVIDEQGLARLEALANTADPDSTFDPLNLAEAEYHDIDSLTEAISTTRQVPDPPFPDSVSVHQILLDIDYGTVNEPAAEEGITAAFGYLLREYLLGIARKLPIATQRSSSPAFITEDGNTTDPSSLQDLLRSKIQEENDVFMGGRPHIDVIVGKSSFEIRATGTRIENLAAVWEALAEGFSTPRLIYHHDNLSFGGGAATLMHQAQIMVEALKKRHQVYAGALWHNDLTLRTGLNGATLAPLDISHEAHRVYPAMNRLAAKLHPNSGKVRHAFHATHPSLMGIGFTQVPRPMSLEELLEETSSYVLSHSEAGSLETDDAQALMSTVFPLSVNGAISAELFSRIVAQLLNEKVGEAATLRADRYVYGDDIVIALAATGDWNVKDARSVVRLMFGIDGHDGDPQAHPVYHEEHLPDHHIAEFIDAYTLDGYIERLLFMRRIESESASPERVRGELERAFSQLHIPQALVDSELSALFPPLVEAHLMMFYYGSGSGMDFPPALEVDDLARSFYEDDGEYFLGRYPAQPGRSPFLAPDRLSISERGLSVEWFETRNPTSPLTRRIAFTWGEVRAWINIGEAIALMDHAGRVMFIVPTLFDRVGPLYELLRGWEKKLSADGVIMRRGGERQLRAHVRDAIAQTVAKAHRENKRQEVLAVESNSRSSVTYRPPSQPQTAWSFTQSLAGLAVVIVGSFYLWQWGM